MKTFDEAMRAAVIQQDYIIPVLNASANDHLDNEAFREWLVIIATLTIGRFAKREKEVYAILLATLVIAFEFGVVIGREMYGEPATLETETIQ